MIGPTNDIDRFDQDVSRYRTDDTFLFNACWKFLEPENVGTYFLDSMSRGEVFANRYQVLDQIVVSRGLLAPPALRLDADSVTIYTDNKTVATPAGRPRPFNTTTMKGYSDHLPVIATLTYE